MNKNKKRMEHGAWGRALPYALCIVLFLLLWSCRGGDTTVIPAPPVVPPSNAETAHFYWDELQVSYYSDGTVRPVLGYRVHCQAADKEITLDVGKVTVCYPKDLGLVPGVWQCSVSAYDEVGATPYTVPIAIKYENGNYSTP
jgi:hypothetical protein